MVTNEYLEVSIEELNNIINTSFKKLNYVILDIKSQLELLTKEVKNLKQCCKKEDLPENNKLDYNDQFTFIGSTGQSSVNKNLKHVFHLAKMSPDLTGKDAKKNQQACEDMVQSGSKELSIDIVDQTPSRENIFRKRKIEKVEQCLKEYRVNGNPLKKMTRTCTAYNPFAMVDQAKADWLDSWMKIKRDATIDLGTSDGKVDKRFFLDFMTPTRWLDDRHINTGMSLLRRRLSKIPCPFRSERLAFMDIPFTILINSIYKNFSENSKEFVWSSMLIDYFNGILPRCGKTNKRLGVDVDDVYVILNIKNNHWIALDISILRRQIDVYDSSALHSGDKELFEFVKPYAKLFPHFISSLALPVDQNASTAQYTIKMQNKIPRNIQSGDCGIYALKYIECLALNCDMQVGLCDANMRNIRKKMATEVFVGADHYGEL